jgi:hypothetical protein
VTQESPPGPSLQDVVERALAAHATLAAVAEPLEDEAQYVTDLLAVYSARLRSWVVDDPSRSVDAVARAAVAAAIEEVRLIEDPHRAIDWLSTFPQVVGLALGRRP